MRKRYELKVLGFVIALLTIFSIQSCDEVSESVAPEDVNVTVGTNARLASGMMEWTGEVPDPCKQVCLVAGQHMNVGTVDVAVVGDELLVTYNIVEEGVYLEEVHLDIFTSVEQLEDMKKVSKGGAIPGKFNYQASWSAEEMVTTHTVKISKAYIDQVTDGSDCFFIASHAALSNGETAWGGLCEKTDKGVTLDVAKQFPGNNWSVFFEFCMDECRSAVIDYTYAWEDLQNSGNDADYNDLVIQSDVIEATSEVKIRFFATARGASFDHSFKIKIPMDGIINIFDSEHPAIYTDDGMYYYITVFISTKTVLPKETGLRFSNTEPDDHTCDPTFEKLITLTIDDDFVLNEETPYEPFISVFQSGNYMIGSSYDLYIWEVSGRDTYMLNGKEYPNGILISDDWKWPYERTKVTLAYEDFRSITDGWNPDWADNLSDPSKVWSCE